MKKLVSINPVNQNKKGLSETRYFCYPPPGLGIIAALTPDDWGKYTITEVVFKPELMIQRELSAIMRTTYRKIYSYFTIFYKTMKTWYQTRSLNEAKWAFWSDLSYGNFLYPKKREAL